MNTRAELPHLSPDHPDAPREDAVDRHAQDPHKTIEIKAEIRRAHERRDARVAEATSRVESDLQQEANLDVLVAKYEQDVAALKQELNQLTDNNELLQQTLLLAEATLSHARERQSEQQARTQAERLAPTGENPMAEVIEPEVFTSEEAPSLLGRFNAWLRGSGRKEQSSLSTSAYAETQTDTAQSTRNANRAKEQVKIADHALEGNRRALEEERTSLKSAEANLAQASFLTRWFYQDQVSKLQDRIRFREAAIAAREKQQAQQEAA